MQERLNQYRPILAVLIVACGLMAAVTSRYDMPLFYICLGAWALLSLGCIIWMTVIPAEPPPLWKIEGFAGAHHERRRAVPAHAVPHRAGKR